MSEQAIKPASQTFDVADAERLLMTPKETKSPFMAFILICAKP
ncbi:MAG: hypothetical protein QHD01_25510 [Bradyrhizobium sp.]|nr:hypothetical protein [Bradyrhizobium sp.]MDX3969934.1 hypothetical protein [Bradyrhizobium sp.]